MMKITIEGLFEINAVLSRGLNGVDVATGKRIEPVKELPTGIFRHLRRLHKAVKDELEIIAPEHKDFIAKWAVDGKFPAPNAKNFKEFASAYTEFFGDTVTIPFSPFKLEMLDDLKVVVPTDLMNLMETVNDVIEDEMKVKEKEIPPATAVNDNGPVSPKADA